MKKNILSFICIIAIANIVTAQYVTIPDTLFRNFLMTKYPTCFNAAKQMDTTCNKIVTETAIDATNLNFTSISGIEYFDSLKNLNVSNNKITSISKFPNNLLNFICENNKLTGLPTLPNSLKKLVFKGANGYNQNTTLPILPPHLTFLDCTNSYIGQLPASLPNLLDTLIVSVCNLTVLPASLPNNLLYLNCYNNKIASLPSLPSTIQYLSCGVNLLNNLPILPNSLIYLMIPYNPNIPISSLAIPSGLLYFDCSGCNLNSLPSLPNNLKQLIISSNNFTTLPATLPSALTKLDCSNNKLLNLPNLPNGLLGLDCSNNLLTSLPFIPNGVNTLYCNSNPSLFCLPKLPYYLYFLRIDSSNIKCLPNAINPTCSIYQPGATSYYFTPPICNATNNPNQCLALPTVIGKVFYDNNSNGIKDVGEPYKVFGKVALSNGDYSLTDANGSYAISTDNTGTYTITATPPAFFNAVPANKSITFNRYDTTIVLPDIALQPNTVKDSLAIIATPLYGKARPGFSFPYYIAYANVGTTSPTAIMDFTFDSTRLNFNYCTDPAITNAGSVFTTIKPTLVAGTINSFIAGFSVKSTATLGDTLKAFANITTTFLTTVSDTSNTIITGAFDPNEKDATPTLTPTQVALGKPINYTIHFQNTGTDTAFNVVVADSLSTLLQTNTLQVISSSHNCKVSVKNGVAYFEFLNIKLPDSNVNELRSHGFVRFTIKPKTNLTAGVNIYNKAYIYFDYNAAIVTNTAVTQIKNAVVTPLKITSYELRIVNEKNVENIWTTANEINVSHFNIQRSVNGKDFITIGKVKANNKNANEYSFIDNNVNNTTNYYRIVAVDNDGQLNYSTTKFITFNTKLSSVRIYPNPATSIVNIESKDAKQITIIDYFGRTIYKSIINSEKLMVDTKQFAKGIYIVQVVLQNGSIINEKLIVE